MGYNASKAFYRLRKGQCCFAYKNNISASILHLACLEKTSHILYTMAYIVKINCVTQPHMLRRH